MPGWRGGRGRAVVSGDGVSLQKNSVATPRPTHAKAGFILTID